MATKTFKNNPLRSLSTLVLMVLISISLFCPENIYAQDSEKILKQKAFERVFGDTVRLDPAMVEKVMNDTPGKRHYVDIDGDGKPEEVWFIDIEPHHSEDKRPILVKVVDENGNLEMGREPEKYG